MRLHLVAIGTVIALSFVVPLVAAIASCKQEQEKGQTQFEVKLAATNGKGMSVDVSPDGTILLTEQIVAVSDVPPAVMKAFVAKYGAAKPTRAEMQTAADGKVTYEIAFAAGATKKEAPSITLGKGVVIDNLRWRRSPTIGLPPTHLVRRSRA